MIEQRLGGETQTKNYSKRWIGFFAVLLVVVIYIVFRYGELMLGGTGNAPLRRQTGGAERGSIFDRNGRILAIEALFGDVGISPSKIKKPAELAAALAPLLDMSESAILARTAAVQDFVYLKKKVDLAAAQSVEALVAEKRLAGVTVDFTRGRVYPEENLAAQIIGFTGDENRGLEGIEFAFDDDLRAQIAADGESVPGSRVVLTIDANIQYILEEIAGRALAEHKAEAVLLTAMDPRSGDILGAASLPAFNPNKFADYNSKVLAFKPATWSYEPGSVFKIFSMAALLDSGFISPATTFFCNGSYDHLTNRGERITIKCLGAHGQVTTRNIIMVSCNAGAGYASDYVSTDIFYDRIRLLGFGFKPGSGAPGEAAGFLRNPSRWSARSKPTIAMGQEIAVSMLQMLKAATAIATDGTLRTPRLVSRITTQDGSLVREYTPSEPVKVMKSETARAMRSYMRDTTSDSGTAWRAFIEDIPLAVKTGTGEIADAATGAYSKTDYLASCMAMLPENEPVLVLYLTIFKPRGEYLGGRIAAPYIKETAEALVNYLGIPRGRNTRVTHPATVRLPPVPVPVVGSTVPNFTGLSKRQVLPLILREDLHFEIAGNGWVRRQSPPPGSKLGPDTVIHLEFE